MWRSTQDIFDSWESIKTLALKEAPLQEYNGRGCFNDMDMLVVGMYGKGNVGLTGCTDVEYRTHFSLWAMLNSPLMIGCDIRNMSDAAKAILTNKEVIAINQDPLCAQPFYINNTKWEINTERKPEDPFYKNLPDEVLLMAKYLDGGDIALGIFNFSDGKASRWHQAVLPDLLGLPAISGKVLEATELWSGETIRSRCGVLDIPDTEPHDCKLYRVKVVG